MTPDIEDFHPSDNDVTLNSVSEADLDNSVSIPVEHERDTISEVDEENNSLVTSLRQAGSDRELRSKGEPQPPPPGPIEDLPQFPDSDSEFTKPTKKVSY